MMKDVKEKGLEPYEAPKMMVYEMEIEGAILEGSPIGFYVNPEGTWLPAEYDEDSL